MTIEWIEAQQERRIPPRAQLALAEAALARRPGDPRLTARRGVLLEKFGRTHEARAALEASLDGAPDTFNEWAELARVLDRFGEGEAALLLCRRGVATRPGAALARTQGDLLRRHGQRGAALDAYEAAIAFPEGSPSALSCLLCLLATDSGAACLERIDALDAGDRHSAVARAWRAVALSKLGRRDAALAILDPARHAIRRRFEPPPEFGGLDAFNARLAGELLSDPPDIPFREDTLINDRPRRDRPALRALHDFGRVALADFVADHARYGLADAPPPALAALDAISSVVVGAGSNRQHIHETSYASAVYHVRVPEAVRLAEDRTGALELGGCDQLVAGYEPCWTRAYHKPVEGWMVLFPSHMFHDVVPTGVAAPRISTAMELTAAVRPG